MIKLLSVVVLFSLQMASQITLAQEKSCIQEIGKAQSDILVKQCRQVSPATRPPCNGSNPCSLIQDEIKRGCEFIGTNSKAMPPEFCKGESTPREKACIDEVGRLKAEALAKQCREVSPATRPPCHFSNPCSMIQSEIERGCEFIATNSKALPPQFCKLDSPKSCADEIGKQKSKVLVDRCLEVSPATHPPCNDSNPCEMIKNEIGRGCNFIGSETKKAIPQYCRQYKYQEDSKSKGTTGQGAP